MTRPSQTQLLVAIGDLHGHRPALDELLAALDRRHGILRTSGGLRRGVTLVTTGDYVDRGSNALGIIERLRELAAGPGRLVTLLGNHELMALEGLQDAAAALVSEEDPVAAYGRSTCHGRNGGTSFIREFGDSPREAMASYLRRMARDGDVGAFLRALRPHHLAKVAGLRVLLTHADVPAPLRSRRRLGRYLQAVDQHLQVGTLDAGGPAAKFGDPLLTDAQTLFWNRSFSGLDPGDAAQAARICAELGVDLVVTGHTPHQSITVTGGRLIDIDVGMTPRCGGHEPEALVIGGGGLVTGVTASGAERILLRPSARLDEAA